MLKCSCCRLVTAERKKKHIALKLPFEAGREILGSSKKTWRQGASCSCQANTEQQRKHIALKAAMPFHCCLVLSRQLQGCLSTVRYYSCSVFSLLAANNSGIYSSLLAYPFTYQQSLKTVGASSPRLPALWLCFYLPVEFLLPASVPIAGPRPDWQVEFQVYVSTRPVAYFCTLS